MPSTLERLYNEALRLHHKGRLPEAMQAYRSVLLQNPEHDGALHMLGVIAMQRGDAKLSVKFITAALTIAPTLADAWCNLSIAYKAIGNNDVAREAAEKSILLNPQYAEGWNLLAQLTSNGEAAKSCYQKALSIQPKNSLYQVNFIYHLLHNQKLVEAHALALQLPNANCEKNILLGKIFKAAGHPVKSISYFLSALDKDPHNEDALINLSTAYLQIGNYQNGLPLYEKRPKLDDRYTCVPNWDGEHVQRLLVYEDQGLGDFIQFIRYLPLLEGCANEIIVATPKPLHSLMCRNFPQYTFYDNIEKPPEANAAIRLLSLPHLLNFTIDNIPVSQNLIAPPDQVKLWAERLGPLPSPRIGLVWAGNSKNIADHRRSIDFQALTPLLEKLGRNICSLQLGDISKQAEYNHFGMYDAASHLTDFSITAAIIANLDLVITVDTAVAHLAGAMGKPVWLANYFSPDWRWLLGHEDSFWYHTMKQYRQKTPGDWDYVVTNILNDLVIYLSGDTDVVRPKKLQDRLFLVAPNAIHLLD